MRADLAQLAARALALAPGDPRGARALAVIDASLLDPERGVLRVHTLDDHAARPSLQAPVPAAWALLAQARAGLGARAWTTFRLLSPAHRAATAGHRYRGEPNALPADVVAAGEHAGEAGRPWGRGGGAWLQRCAVEGLLGLVLQADRLCVAPCLPPGWDEVRLTLWWCERRLHLRLTTDAAAAGGPAARLQPGEWLALAELPPSSEWTVVVPPMRGASGTAEADSIATV